MIGYSHESFWPEAWQLNHPVIFLSNILWCLGLSLFTSGFLDLKNRSSLLRYVNRFFIGFFAIGFLAELAVITIFGESLRAVEMFIYNATAGLFVLYCPFALYAAANVYFKGFRPAKYYLMAFSVFLLVTVTLVLALYDLIGINSRLSYYGYLFGSVVEVLLINLALFDKQKLERSTYRNEIQKANYRLEEANQVLEERVLERTAELSE